MRPARTAVIALLGIVLVFSVACKSEPQVQITYCAAECQTNWLGDGICQDACNNAACYYDNGDCPTPTPTHILCPTITAEPLWAYYNSTTDQLIETIHVHAGRADNVIVSGDTGTFNSTGFDQQGYWLVNVSLLPGTTNNFVVNAHVPLRTIYGCNYSEYDHSYGFHIVQNSSTPIPTPTSLPIGG